MDYSLPEVNELILRDEASEEWLAWRDPRQVLVARQLDEVLPVLQEAEDNAGRDGLVVGGFISYEAGPAFDPALEAHPADGFPLVWLGLYRQATKVDLPHPQGDPLSLAWASLTSQAGYQAAIARVKEHIAAGDTYQVNYTMRMRAFYERAFYERAFYERAASGGAPLDSHEITKAAYNLFLHLAHGGQARLGAYLDTGEHVICSASPELFFTLEGERLTARPMKGTARRGLTLAEDEGQARWLRKSVKNRAENVMIVDMLRNDLGKVARIGSVSVPRLFEVERYPTLWQMTSTVTGKTSASLVEILKALFPCASITGAPKRRTMQIIRELEAQPRHLYTGAIGYYWIGDRKLGDRQSGVRKEGGRRAQFSVAIRTVVVEKASGMAEYGVGGGVVWDSTVEGEYEEALLKTRVLSEQRPEYGPDFALLESLLWAPQAGYTLLDEHLDRLRQAAVYFRLRIDINAVFEHLMALAASLPTLPAGVQAVGGQGYKVRLLVYRDGRVQVEAAPLASPPVPGRVNAGGNESGKQMGVRVALARQPVDPSNPFLYHKTTVREVYERAQRDHPQADDVLLWNPAGELTESCTSNLVALLDGRLATPPVACGLLPGVLRGVLVGRGEIEERSIRVADLARCERLWLINSVRGWREMEVIPYEVNDSAKA